MSSQLNCDEMMKLYFDSIELLENKDNYDDTLSENTGNSFNTVAQGSHTARNIFDNIMKKLQKCSSDDIVNYSEQLMECLKYVKNSSVDLDKMLMLTTELYNNMHDNTNNNNDNVNVICNNFVCSISVSNLSIDNELSNILRMYICAKCKQPITFHKCCSKFEKQNIDVKDNDYDLKKNMCNTCGLEYYYHQSCQQFVYKFDEAKKIIQTCETCGLHHSYHTQVECCNNFDDNNFGYCKTCNHHISGHYYNKKFRKLKNKNEVIQNYLRLTIASMSSGELTYKLLVGDLAMRIYSADYTNLIGIVNKKRYSSVSI